MNIPAEYKYTKNHEWIKMEENNLGAVGITDHAQEQLTDIVFVELPEIGDEFKQGDRVTSIESVKAVSDIYSPASGEIVEQNDKLEDAPEVVNEDPYEKGWIFKMKLTDPAELDKLLDAEEYEKYIEAEA